MSRGKTRGMIIAVIVVIILGVVYLRFRTPEDTWVCQEGIWVKHGNPNFPQPTGSCVEGDQAVPVSETTEISNPASQNCLTQGGKLELIQETAGTLGICRFSDGTACEEWRFFRGECRAGDSAIPDTSHPYTGSIAKVGNRYEITTENGVTYEIMVDPQEVILKERLLAEVGQTLSIVATETPPLSKKLVLIAFPSK